MMVSKHKNNAVRDDSLYGLLTSYKSYNTYVLVMVSEDGNDIVLALSGNPKYWSNMPEDEAESFRVLKRLEIGTDKLSIKYILPEHLVKVFGPSAGMKIPADKIDIDDKLPDEGYYLIKTSVKYAPRILSGVKRLINLTPQKKYEILEKTIAEGQE